MNRLISWLVWGPLEWHARRTGHVWFLYHHGGGRRLRDLRLWCDTPERTWNP